MDERLIRLFEEELRHLRETAAEFGRAFPDRAKHLDPKSRPFEGMVADPYVERLLEGVAFLAARVRLKLDAQFPQFTQGLLETIYPDFLSPLPSMAVFQFSPAPVAPPPPGGFLLRRGAKIQGSPAGQARAGSREPVPCTFSLGHDVRLLPVELAEADWLVRRLHEAKLPASWQCGAALRLRLRKTALVPWTEIPLDPLVVFVPKSDGLGYEILEHLLGHQVGLIVRDSNPRESQDALQLRGQSLRKFGFEPSAALLPSYSRGFEGHRLLREYFAMPERFFFFELRNFQSALAKCLGDELELIIGLDTASNRLEQQVRTSCFRLHCAPAVNLFTRQFSQVIEPDRFSEFHVIPDANRPIEYEVYSVDTVEGFTDSSPFGQPFRPFFETHHLHREGKSFFTVTRQPRSRFEVSRTSSNEAATPYQGSEVFLALVDSEQAPFNGSIDQLLISAQLSNRHLPIALAENPANWSLVGGIKAQVTALVGPTPPSFKPVDGPYAWRLLNLLAINYLSLSDEKGDGASGLRELLALYAGDDCELATQQLGALRGITTGTVSRPLYESNGSDGPPRIAAIVRGMEIALSFDNSAFLELSVVVLGSVLEEFFARYAALNSFTETVLKTPDGRERMRWPARSGLKPLS